MNEVIRFHIQAKINVVLDVGKCFSLVNLQDTDACKQILGLHIER